MRGRAREGGRNKRSLSNSSSDSRFTPLRRARASCSPSRGERGACCAHGEQTCVHTPATRLRPGFAVSPPSEGDGAPKSANPMARIRRCAGASRRASRGRLVGAGPRFPFPEERIDLRLRSSASSWQELIVVPGGAPAPPECRSCEIGPQAPHLVPPHDAS